MNRSSFCLRGLPWLLAASALLAQAPTASPVQPKASTLKIGDPAPAFKASRWLKGKPTGLEKGKVTVVEFWATWCGPCRETIPHLTKMAKARTGKATFIGVDIWERPQEGEDIDKTVDAFVKEMGDRMDYNVCRDSADDHMSKAWMRAAGRNGIPSAFIVDQEGRIAWMGHPMAKMEEALDQIIAGTFDMKAAALAAEKEAAEQKALREKNQARQAAWKEVSPAILDAVKAKDWARVTALADQAEGKYPDLKPTLKRPRFLAMAGTDEAKAKAFVDAEVATPSVGTCMNTAVMLLDAAAPRTWAPRALALIDQAIGLDAKLAEQVVSLRFKALLRCDEGKAKGLWEAEKGKKENDLAGMAEEVLADESLSKTWVEAAVAALETELKAPKAPLQLNEPLAKGYFRLERAREAVAAQEKLLAFAKGKAPEAILKRFEADLKTYQAAVK